jgi:hypothetical protein
LLLRCARASRLGGGGPSNAIISERWALPRYVSCSGSRPVNKCSPSKASQTCNCRQSRPKPVISRWATLTIHPTFQMSTLYVHGKLRREQIQAVSENSWWHDVKDQCECISKSVERCPSRSALNDPCTLKRDSKRMQCPRTIM